jgi:glucosamine-6-phosphate deaminase
LNLLTFETQKELDEVGAGILASAVQTNPRAVLGLATGGTPVGIYEQLVSLYRRGLVSFKDVTTFNLDEYVGLPVDHPESYYSYMRTNLFGHIDAAPERIHLPKGTASDLEGECKAYDQLLESYRIDIQLLGIGHNGHIAFNEPDQNLNSGTFVVRLSEVTRQANARFFDRLEDVPTHAISMGMASILKAKSILLVVRGEDKADILKQALTGPITTACPASLLQTHPNLTVLADTGASKQLLK